MPVIIDLTGGPDWASIMTAFGTVAAAVAAVSIALWSDRRTRTQIKDQRRVAQESEQLAGPASMTYPCGGF